MRSFILAAIAGVSLAQIPQAYDQCKADIAAAQLQLAEVETTCKAQAPRLGALTGNLAPITTILPYYNEQIVQNAAVVQATDATNTYQDTLIASLETRLAAVQIKIGANAAKVTTFHTSLMSLTTILDQLEGLESMETMTTMNNGINDTNIGLLQATIDNIDTTPLGTAAIALAEINTYATPTTGQVAVNTAAIDTFKLNTLSPLEQRIKAQIPNYDYYNVDAVPFALANTPMQEYKEFVVCNGDVLEFWFDITVRGMGVTTLEKVYLEREVNGVIDTVAAASITKTAANEDSEHYSLFYKEDTMANSITAQVTYRIKFDLIVNSVLPEIPDNGLQWGYRTYDSMLNPITSVAPTAC